MQVFGLVALACRASPHVVLDHRPQPWRVEVTAQPVECALDALVAVVMHPGEHLVEEQRCRRDVELALERHQAVDQRPWRRTLGVGDLGPERHQCGIRAVGVAEAVYEIKPWP